MTIQTPTDPDALPDNPVLREALVDGTVEHPDGSKREITANINPHNSVALYRTVLERKPELVVEIGMAYGASTLTILSALEELGRGRLISIDPYIGWPNGRLVALHQVERAGFSHRHEHRHTTSCRALAQLIAEQAQPDLVYIDGSHKLDDVFVDFYLADQLLQPGGAVGFNDAGWRSVHRVIRYLQHERRYRELEVGLPRVYRGRNFATSLLRRMQGRSTYDRYFEKVEHYEPPE